MKAVQLLVNSRLPERYRDYTRNYTVKDVKAFLSDLAVEDPDSFDQTVRGIADAGRNASYWQGETIGLDDLTPRVDKASVFSQMEAELQQLNPDDPKFKAKRSEIWMKYNDLLQKMTEETYGGTGNSIADAILSGARGKNAQLKMMLTTPGLYSGPGGDVVPMFIRNSFSEGLRPAESLASTYGARSAVTSTKRATAVGGDMLKQMVQSSVPTVVTEDTCGTDNGIDLPVGDESLRGRVLARGVGDLPAGTVLDRASLKTLEKSGVKNVIVRSPMTCQAHDGVCAKCVGKFFDRKFPKIGQAVGITAAQSVFEPVTQGALNTKHTGGAAKGKREFSGMKYLTQFIQSPEEFSDRAAVSEVDGVVRSIEEAPQGGYFVYVDDQEHYVPQGFEVRVKQGDTVEAGDQLSEGLVDAMDVVRLRGLGEGRRYYAERLHKMLGDSGFAAKRQNVELLARGAINHVHIDDDEGMPGVLPDDTIQYNQFIHQYTPPKDTQRVPLRSAVGQYLQAPALHYSLGTRVTPSMTRRLEEAGIEEVMTSPETPRFSPEMVRLRTATKANPDWLARMTSSYIKDTLETASTRGEDTNVLSNPHYVPRLAFGKDFGKQVETTGKF